MQIILSSLREEMNSEYGVMFYSRGGPHAGHRAALKAALLQCLWEAGKIGSGWMKSSTSKNYSE